MWDFEATMTFTLVAAAVQLLIGGVLIIRNPRNERIAVLGALFVLNGLEQSCVFLQAGFELPRAAAALEATRQIADFSTNLSILVLALIYPRRARWMQRMPHAAVLLGVLISILIVVRFTLGEDMVASRDRGTLDAGAVLFSLGIFELAFPVMMLRWAWLWGSDMSPELRRQFALIFGALGIRAMHQFGQVTPGKIQDILGGRDATLMGVILGAMLMAIIVAAFAASVIRLILTRPDARWRSWHGLLLVLLGFGAIEGIVAFAGEGSGWGGKWQALATDFDVLVVRPALIWLAVVRFELISAHWHRSTTAWAFVWLLAGATALEAIIINIGSEQGVSEWLVAAIMAATLATIFTFIARAAASRLPELDVQPDEVYSAHVDEAHREGTPDPVSLARLATWRRRLELEDESIQ